MLTGEVPWPEHVRRVDRERGRRNGITLVPEPDASARHYSPDNND